MSENRFWVDEEEWEHADRMLAGIMGDEATRAYAEFSSFDTEENIILTDGISDFLHRRYDR